MRIYNMRIYISYIRIYIYILYSTKSAEEYFSGACQITMQMEFELNFADGI